MTGTYQDMTNNKPEIEKHRVLHDLGTQFDLPKEVESLLKTQLSSDDQTRLERFVTGFEIEDWFEWIFSAMPWCQLIHGLDQQQFPQRSKSTYQVPDFLMFVETSSMNHQPLLIDVKRVPHRKETLKIQSSQLELLQSYADRLATPFLFAVYWEKFNAWTLNTPDSFRKNKSTRKLSLYRALELDCGLILGDVSYLIPQTLVRISTFTQKPSEEHAVIHEQFGTLVSDHAILGDNRVDMNSSESAAIDAMMTMVTHERRSTDDGKTILTEHLDSTYGLKLSSWITRHLAKFNVTPTSEYANVSAHVISELMGKLECPQMQLFPSNATKEIISISNMFFNGDETAA